MQPAKYRISLIITICLGLILSGCSSSGKTPEQNVTDNEQPQETDTVIQWDEISEDGIDEEKLINSIDEVTLRTVAEKLQDVCDKVNEKGEIDKYYWLTGQWYSNIVDSSEYSEVVALGNKAMKPLLLIIYKSPEAGMYEWTCSKALEEISGFDFSNENNGVGWRNSKEFLKMFIDRIIEQKA